VGKSWILIAAILGSSMTFIDGSAVNVALPVIQLDLQATSEQTQWVVEAYALFLAALILVGGSLGDVYGRKRMFAAGIALFAAASLACALAPTIAALTIARAIQGVGAALAMPESLALISANFSGAERGRAIGTWSGFASITGAAGPVIGGWLTQTASWRWVFIINLPLALAVLAIVMRHVPESRDEAGARSIDWSGAVLATAGLGALVDGLIRLQGGNASPAGWAMAAAGIAILALFVWAERRARHPMVPPALFRSRVFAAANVYTFGVYAALGGSLYFLPFVLIDVQKYTPAAAGAVFLPFIALQFAGSRWSGGLAARIGARTPLVAGALLAGIAFVAFAIPGIGGSYWTTYFPAVVVLGIGGVLFVAPLTTTVFDASDPAQSGVASAINNAVARTAGLVAIALFGIVLSAAFARAFDGQLARYAVAPGTHAVALAEPGAFIAGTVPENIPPADRPAVAGAVRSSFLAGFRAVMVTSAIVCFISAAFAAVALPRRAAVPSG
jgi:EmrB/QacA subfamily drug resistance transporter